MNVVPIKVIKCALVNVLYSYTVRLEVYKDSVWKNYNENKLSLPHIITYIHSKITSLKIQSVSLQRINPHVNFPKYEISRPL